MIVLGLGSSIAPREYYLKKAINELNNNPDIKVIKISKIYKTAAWGGVAKNTFLNLCLEISFYSSPEDLLKITQNIENKLGRIRKEHWGDRTIDIDILLFNNILLNNDILTIPHPFITERNFVLLPLIDICGDIKINNKKLSYWLKYIKSDIEIYK